MKKILLLALPLMVMCFASCEKNNGEISKDNIIQFEDPNFLKALLCVQEIMMYDYEIDDFIMYLVDVDKNKDSQISVNEAKLVRGLDLFNFNVQSMPEIKYFTSLTSLNCDDNQLTSLDVSQNTALMELYCDSNQLASLDVSQNTALRDLDCKNNKLTALDVSKNTALTQLFCSDNQLATLNVSKNTALITLWCGNNQLTSLDVSNNTALWELRCGGNQLETLIISQSQQNARWLDDVKAEYPNLNIEVKE